MDIWVNRTDLIRMRVDSISMTKAYSSIKIVNQTNKYKYIWYFMCILPLSLKLQ